MSQLPIYHGASREMSLMQTQWASLINPAINAPLLQGNYLNNIALVSGDNTINHLLGRAYQGWLLTGMHGAFIELYDVPSPMPTLTLVLNANTSGSISLYVF